MRDARAGEGLRHWGCRGVPTGHRHTGLQDGKRGEAGSDEVDWRGRRGLILSDAGEPLPPMNRKATLAAVHAVRLPARSAARMFPPSRPSQTFAEYSSGRILQRSCLLHSAFRGRVSPPTRREAENEAETTGSDITYVPRVQRASIVPVSPGVRIRVEKHRSNLEPLVAKLFLEISLRSPAHRWPRRS